MNVSLKHIFYLVRLDPLPADALATVDKAILAYPTSPIPFRTFPDPLLPAGSHFKFIVSSCMVPNHPYNGPLHRKTIRGFDLLAEHLYPEAIPVQITESSAEQRNMTHSRQLSAPAEFLLFLGDFIYADTPVYVGDHQESFRRLYRRNYQSDSFRRIYERLRECHHNPFPACFEDDKNHSYLSCLR